MKRLFWRLPYTLRRGLYRVCRPANYATLKRLRSADPGPPDIPTFRPFIEQRCIFVHIPKVAGISINHGLFGRQTGYHTTIAEYQLAFRRREFHRFFSFTFVRNPWDRLVSAYLYLKQGGMNDIDRRWAEEHLSSYDSFEAFVLQWVNRANIFKGQHFRPQHTFITLPGRRRPGVDFIGYFENMDQDYARVRETLGCGTELPFENPTKGKRDDYRSYYSARTREVVAEAYADDIALLGYDFEGRRKIP